MRAAVLRGYGAPREVRVAEVPAPAAGRGQLLVRVRAASLNPLDAKLRSGAFRRVMPLAFPAILGFDFSGVVEAVGEGVAGWLPGERVYGRTDAKTGGTHAEFAVVAAGVTDRMPQALSFEEAASLPLAAMTALQGLEWARLAAGERLLVNGAAGGVGSLAVQVGRAMGATVSGVVRGEGAVLLEGFGVRVLDEARGELSRCGERFDVVLDTVPGDPSAALDRVLGRRGRYVTTGFSARLLRLAVLRRLRGQRLGFILSRADGRLLRAVSALVNEGRMRPVVAETFPLERIAEAHERLERGHLRGKVVVTMS